MRTGKTLKTSPAPLLRRVARQLKRESTRTDCSLECLVRGPDQIFFAEKVGGDYQPLSPARQKEIVRAIHAKARQEGLSLATDRFSLSVETRKGPLSPAESQAWLQSSTAAYLFEPPADESSEMVKLAALLVESYPTEAELEMLGEQLQALRSPRSPAEDTWLLVTIHQLMAGRNAVRNFLVPDLRLELTALHRSLEAARTRELAKLHQLFQGQISLKQVFPHLTCSTVDLDQPVQRVVDHLWALVSARFPSPRGGEEQRKALLAQLGNLRLWLDPAGWEQGFDPKDHVSVGIALSDLPKQSGFTPAEERLMERLAEHVVSMGWKPPQAS